MQRLPSWKGTVGISALSQTSREDLVTRLRTLPRIWTAYSFRCLAVSLDQQAPEGKDLGGWSGWRPGVTHR